MPAIVVSGALANKPLNGGEAWVRLNWILGFQKLGFQVYFVEEIKRESCLDARGACTSFENSLNLAYFKKITGQFGLTDSACLIYENGEQHYGLSYSEILDLAPTVVLLINISGHLISQPLLSRFRYKVFIDIDPGFTQFWHAAGNPGANLAGHDCYFTIGENIGAPACSIPTCGITWHRIRQPVMLREWPMSECIRGRFTTIASWRGPYGPVRHKGKSFGLKVHEFRKFVELPERGQQQFEIALSIHPADEKDLHSLRHHGWHIADPKVVAGDPMTFRQYVQASGAEFSVAQGIYVETESGWFSDRTVRYLASGKPALVQDTGFTRNYPVGKGLMAFRTLDQAVAGAREIMHDYKDHCRAARSLAETYFDSDKVLGQLVKEVGVSL